MEWVHEPASLAKPGTLGNPDSGIFVGVGGSLIGLAILGLAIYGAVVLVKRY